jgi:hypothetical protein
MTANRLLPAAVAALAFAGAAHAQEWQSKSGSSYARRREGRLKAALFIWAYQGSSTAHHGDLIE